MSQVLIFFASSTLVAFHGAKNEFKWDSFHVSPLQVDLVKLGSLRDTSTKYACTLNGI